MKEMMQKAREEKKKGEYKALEESTEETNKFFKDVKEKAEQRFQEKQDGIEHSEQVDIFEKTEVEKENESFNKKGAEQYDQARIENAKKPLEIQKTGGPQKIEEVKNLENEEEIEA